MNRFSLRPGDFWWGAKDVIWPRELHEGTIDGVESRVVELDGVPTHFILEMKDAKVVGDGRLLATAGGTVLADIQGLFGVKKPEDHHFLDPRARIPTRLAGRSFLVAGSCGNNYYHWLFDSLPRIHLAQIAGIALTDIDHILVPQRMAPFVRDSLRLCGIPTNKLKPMHSKEVLQCEQLIATEMPTPFHVFPEWVLEFLKRKLQPEPKGNNGELVYVSRRDATTRRVQNEEELVAELSPLGFSVIVPSEMSFRQQPTCSRVPASSLPHTGPDSPTFCFRTPGHTSLNYAARTTNPSASRFSPGNWGCTPRGLIAPLRTISLH